MLTTKDNPFNPYDQFDLWLMFDIEKGYQTCERLGRIIKLDDDMSEKEKDEAMKRAIDEIIAHDPLNIYCRATENNPAPAFN